MSRDLGIQEIAVARCRDPFLSADPCGQPHRIKYLEAIYEYAARFEGVLHWNGLEILEWYQAARR